MANTLTIELLPQKQIFTIEMDPDTQIHELLDYIQIQYNLNPQTKNWTCYSNLKRMFLDHNSSIGNTNNDKLTINASANPGQQQNTPNSDLINSSNKISTASNQQQGSPYGNQQQQGSQQQNPYQNQYPQQVSNRQYLQNQTQTNNFNQSQQQSSGQEQPYQVTVHFSIVDGNIKREFKSTFKSDDRLEDLADAVLAYLGVSKQWASCDLVLYNQNYNTGAKREKTLQQLSIKQDQTIEARLRWIGGSEY